MRSVRSLAIPLLVAVVVFSWASSSASAAIVLFQLQGNAGAGLLGGNENPVRVGGSGGAVGAGIFFDDVASDLTINVAWGSGNGFTDLTGAAIGMHIHDANSADFSENGGIAIGLDGLAGFDPDATSGGFSGTVNLTPARAADLLAGHFYINVHTAANPNGEIRGNLVAVPEPSVAAVLALLVPGIALLRRRRK